MKVKSSIKRLCNFCLFINRGKKKYVYCKKVKKHKQKQN